MLAVGLWVEWLIGLIVSLIGFYGVSTGFAIVVRVFGRVRDSIRLNDA